MFEYDYAQDLEWLQTFIRYRLSQEYPVFKEQYNSLTEDLQLYTDSLEEQKKEER